MKELSQLLSFSINRVRISIFGVLTEFGCVLTCAWTIGRGFMFVMWQRSSKEEERVCSKGITDLKNFRGNSKGILEELREEGGRGGGVED